MCVKSASVISGNLRAESLAGVRQWATPACAIPYQSSSGIVAATAGKTTAARVGDETGKSQADGAGQQYGGVGPLHHPMKHKRLSRETRTHTRFV